MSKHRITRRSFLEQTSAAAALALTSSVPGCPKRWFGDGNPFRLRNSLPDPLRAAGTPDDTLPFDHVIVVMMENHSFDNYFGMLPLRGQPKADGFVFDDNGEPLNFNPCEGGFQRSFRIQGTCQPTSVTQAWNDTYRQINNGRMDGFAMTSAGAMGYWDEEDIPFYYSLAKTFCLGNRCFASLPGQTYPNRRFLYAGTAQGTVNTNLNMLKMRSPVNGTLMDRLSRYGVSWRNYFTDVPATALVSDHLRKYPFHYSLMPKFFEDCAKGRLPAVSFLDPEFGLMNEIGQILFSYIYQRLDEKYPDLPPPIKTALRSLETKIRALGGDEENPMDIALGERFVARVVNAVMASPQWERTLLVWMYDEHGGYYDHVPPVSVPTPDEISPILQPGDYPGRYDLTGPRIPTVVVSPYSRSNDVTNVMHDHTSVIATIAKKWNLPALTNRDAKASSLLDFLDLESPPAFLVPPVLAAPGKPEGIFHCRGLPSDPIVEPEPPSEIPA